MAIPSPVQALNGLHVSMANLHRAPSPRLPRTSEVVRFWGRRTDNRSSQSAILLEIFFIDFREKLYLGIHSFFSLLLTWIGSVCRRARVSDAQCIKKYNTNNAMVIKKTFLYFGHWFYPTVFVWLLIGVRSDCSIRW